MTFAAKFLPARTLNISINTALNQWVHRLEPEHFEESLSKINPALSGTRVAIFVHENPSTLSVVTGGKMLSPYDIVVSNTDGRFTSGFMRVHPRWNKSLQSLVINGAAKETKAKHFLPLPCWEVDVPSHGFSHNSLINLPFLKKGKYIVRPENAARSIGQLVIDTNVIDIHHAIGSFKEDWFKKDTILPDGVLAYSGMEKVEDESLAYFKQKYFIQEVVENVAAEFRIILDADGVISHVLKRPRDDVGNGNVEYKAVIGLKDEMVFEELSGTTIYTNAAYYNKLAKALDTSPEKAKEIQLTLKAMRVKCNSVDLFIQPEGSNAGKWGVFEFCNEFSTSDWSSDSTLNLMKCWFERLFRDYFVYLKDKT